MFRGECENEEINALFIDYQISSSRCKARVGSSESRQAPSVTSLVECDSILARLFEPVLTRILEDSSQYIKLNLSPTKNLESKSNGHRKYGLQNIASFTMKTYFLPIVLKNAGFFLSKYSYF